MVWRLSKTSLFLCDSSLPAFVPASAIYRKLLKYPEEGGRDVRKGGRRAPDRRHAGREGKGGKNKKRWKDTIGSGSRFQKVELARQWAREAGKKESEGEKEGARRGKTDGGRRTYPGGWRRRKEKPEEKEEVEVEGRREIKMAAPAPGSTHPLFLLAVIKGKRGENWGATLKVVGRPVGVPRTRRRTGWRGGTGGWGGRGMGIRGGNSSYWFRGATLTEEQAWWTRSWTSLLLALSLFCSFSPDLTSFLSLSLSRCASKLGFCEQVLLHLPPSTVIHRILLFPSSCRLAKTISKYVDRFDLRACDRSPHDPSTS